MYKKLYNLSIEHLIKIRSHIGHKHNSLNLKINPYIYGIRHNINIFNVEKFWKLYRYLFYNLVENISQRQSFFLVGTNKNLPMNLLTFKFLNNYLTDDLKERLKTPKEKKKEKEEKERDLEFFQFKLKDIGVNKGEKLNGREKEFLSNDSYVDKKKYIYEKNLVESYDFQNYKPFYIKGYIMDKWINGLFSNWKITLDFVNYIKQLPELKKNRYLRYLHYLKGVNENQKPLPDFLLVLHAENNVLKETKNLNIPILGIVDTNMDPDYFLYKMLGNNDSLNNIEFLFLLVDEAIKEGRFKEQQLFFFYFLVKLKNKTKKFK